MRKIPLPKFLSGLKFGRPRNGRRLTSLHGPRILGAGVNGSIALLYLGVFIVLPFSGVVITAFREGFDGLLQSLGRADSLSALGLSMGLMLAALPINVIFGLAAAWLLARFRFPGRSLLLTLINLPLSLSPVIVGLIFVLLYGKNAALGGLLESAGIRIIFSWPGLLLTTIFVSFPYMVRELLPVLEDLGTEDEEAAMTLGANSWNTFWRVTLPNIRLALLYGITLSSARALGEFGATSVVSGLLRGRTVTLPIQVQIYYAEYMTTAAFSAAVVFLLFGLVTLIAKRSLELRMKTSRESS